MKQSSLSYLPSSKQEELKSIAGLIFNNCADIEKIILFGSYARGDFREEKAPAPNRKSAHISDYDILAVTQWKETALDSGLWDRISKLCNAGKKLMPVRIITHDIETLNLKLSEGQYFFSDIKKEGIPLYDSGRFELAEEGELSAAERKRIAFEHFSYWFGSAKSFFKIYQFCIQESELTKAAFNLHQATESAYKCLLLTLTNYCPDEHFLELLADDAQNLVPRLQNIFPKNSDEDRERFKLLEYAYIGGRYDSRYSISKEDLEILAQSVEKLLGIAEEVCKKVVS